jgi:ubiquitin-like modifier-activating enzyme ATG7
LSFIAAAYCVEIMVALLQSPLEITHPGPNIRHFNTGSNGDDDGGDDDDGDLVVIPHQIRGSLANFTQISPMTPNFSFCKRFLINYNIIYFI